jgi:hypothetical protein
LLNREMFGRAPSLFETITGLGRLHRTTIHESKKRLGSLRALARKFYWRFWLFRCELCHG